MRKPFALNEIQFEIKLWTYVRCRTTNRKIKIELTNFCIFVTKQNH